MNYTHARSLTPHLEYFKGAESEEGWGDSGDDGASLANGVSVVENVAYDAGVRSDARARASGWHAWRNIGVLDREWGRGIYAI